MFKKLPINKIVRDVKALRDVKKAKDILSYIPFDFNEYKYRDLWALESLTALQLRRELKYYSYEDAYFSNEGLCIRFNRDGRYAHGSAMVGSFYEMLEVAVKQNADVLSKDLVVNMPIESKHRFDQFRKKAVKQGLLYNEDDGKALFKALKGLYVLICKPRVFIGKSPNKCHTDAVYISPSLGICMSGKYHLSPIGVSITYGYRADSSSWKLYFCGNKAADDFMNGVNYDKHGSPDFLEAVIDCTRFIRKYTREIDYWDDLCGAYKKLYKKYHTVRYYYDSYSHGYRGMLVGIGPDGNEVVENLFEEQSAFMNTLARLQKAKIGGIQIKLSPIKNYNGFGGEGWVIKRVK